MRAGNFILGGDERRIFLPNPLPPDPKLHFDTEMRTLLAEAEKSVYSLGGALNALSAFPDIIRAIMLTDAIYSLRIDGGEISLENYFAALASGRDEIAAETNNALSALTLGLNLLKNVGSSSHIFRSVHSELTGRKDEASGQYRAGEKNLGKQRDIIADYLPPDPENISGLMAGLEKYISTDISYPQLINAALIHAQFEMIHPFSSGNGKLGRILILLHLKWKRLLPVPALLISEQLNRQRPEYFGRLSALELNGDWESWIKFFLGIVRSSANRTLAVVSALSESKNRAVSAMIEKKFVTPAALELMQLLWIQPVVTLPYLTERLRFTKQTANAAVSRFAEENILVETTGQMRNRIFLFKDYFCSFSENK